MLFNEHCRQSKSEEDLEKKAPGKGKGRYRRASSSAQPSPQSTIPTGTSPLDTGIPESSTPSYGKVKNPPFKHATTAEPAHDHHSQLQDVSATFHEQLSLADDSHTTRSLYSHSIGRINDGMELLPDFWEEVRLPDGRSLFVDHQTESTTWDDPRSARNASPSPEPLRPSVWDAQLVAGHPDDMYDPADTFIGNHPFPDLVGDGYLVDDELPGSELRRGTLPDFWEERRGVDGCAYYIDHIGCRIIRKPS